MGLAQDTRADGSHQLERADSGERVAALRQASYGHEQAMGCCALEDVLAHGLMAVVLSTPRDVDEIMRLRERFTSPAKVVPRGTAFDALRSRAASRSH